VLRLEGLPAPEIDRANQKFQEFKAYLEHLATRNTFCNADELAPLVTGGGACQVCPAAGSRHGVDGLRQAANLLLLEYLAANILATQLAKLAQSSGAVNPNENVLRQETQLI